MKKYKISTDCWGAKYWLTNGTLHREDGPAHEWPGGYREWRKAGKLHREDGPAIINFNGEKYWFLNGKELDVEEYIIVIQVSRG